MSVARPVDASKPEPVTLPGWPSCHDCIVSSDDDLAVACGAVVHILTPRSQATSRDPGPHSQWQIYSFRVNQFYEHEWPYQQLATIGALSLGEEQSDSVVYSLAWSPAGLGIHNRPVLAILTSNLVLSIWETDGSLGHYKRTCIINNSLNRGHLSEPSHASHRPTRRIRSFCWSPVLLTERSAKRGLHHLVVANDEDKIFMLQISKTISSSYGEWTITNKLQIDLTAETLSSIDSNLISPLELVMLTDTRVLKIDQHGWVPKDHSTAMAGPHSFTTTIEVERGQQKQMFAVVASHASDSLENNDKSNDAANSIEIQLEGHIDTHIKETSMGPTQAGLADNPHAKLDDIFAGPLQTLRKAFSEQHKLFGNDRIRFWGVTRISKAMGYAACITLHPLDMIEHTTPALERCTIIFTRPARNQRRKDQLEHTETETIEQIMAFSALTASSQSYLINQSLDFEILLVQYMLAKTLNSSLDDQESLRNAVAEASLRFPTHTDQPVAQSKDVVNVQSFVPGVRMEMADLLPVDHLEICEICGATIPFSRDFNATICRNGHQFSRCGISFVAIQEPGISKYCSGCGKQFLDLGKLGISRGPSFTRTLFEEFDVCPYCGAKFHG